MSFTKMDVICALEEIHGVDLGQGYKNRQACSVFVDYIALEQRQYLASTLEKSSIQADGSYRFRKFGGGALFSLIF